MPGRREQAPVLLIRLDGATVEPFLEQHGGLERRFVAQVQIGELFQIAAELEQAGVVSGFVQYQRFFLPILPAQLRCKRQNPLTLREILDHETERFDDIVRLLEFVIEDVQELPPWLVADLAIVVGELDSTPHGRDSIGISLKLIINRR